MKTRLAATRALPFAAALALAATLANPGAARAENHQERRGNPFHLLGHVLAPVGNAVGFLVVEPFFWVVDNVPAVFRLD
ncbi:MAG: hypothetical protein IPK07_03555 [Deltaproteobacteria bacterium]|nr:hypothetical protein [Deltaproteobacteria bacterium]